MKKVRLSLIIVVLGFILISCSGPSYLPCPTEKYRIAEKTATFVIQNMDNHAQTETSKMIAHYDGFDVEYEVSSNFVVSFVIMNNTNKSMLIDKSKCYVLYDGYSTMLYKDVRSSRSTTFNNVQDALNNVQTNESGVLMTIPPYSKYKIPLEETNLRSLKKVPTNFEIEGYSTVSVFDNPEVVEFIIPYSYDYSMAKWETSRNKVYVGGVNVVYREVLYLSARPLDEDKIPRMINSNQYYWALDFGAEDNPELRRIKAINRKRFERHDKAVDTWRTIGFIVTLPLLIPAIWIVPHMEMGCENTNHYPPCM